MRGCSYPCISVSFEHLQKIVNETQTFRSTQNLNLTPTLTLPLILNRLALSIAHRFLIKTNPFKWTMCRWIGYHGQLYRRDIHLMNLSSKRKRRPFHLSHAHDLHKDAFTFCRLRRLPQTTSARGICWAKRASAGSTKARWMTGRLSQSRSWRKTISTAPRNSRYDTC